jgi:hypothetical protein
MPAAHAQIESKRCRVPREISTPKSELPYSDEQLEQFTLELAAALSKPGAFDPIFDRIDELLKKARARR